MSGLEEILIPALISAVPGIIKEVRQTFGRGSPPRSAQKKASANVKRGNSVRKKKSGSNNSRSSRSMQRKKEFYPFKWRPFIAQNYNTVKRRRQGLVRHAVSDALAETTGNKEAIIASEVPAAYSTTASNTFRITHSKNGDSVKLVGHEFVNKIGDMYAAPSGTTLHALMLNPTFWSDTKAARYAHMYQKYRVNKIEFIYIPAVGTNTTGSLAMGVFADPTEVPAVLSVGGEKCVRSVMSLNCSEMFQVYQPTTLTFENKSKRWYYCVPAPDDLEGNLANSGMFVVVAASDLASHTNYGTLSIKYELEYSEPILTEHLPAGTAEIRMYCPGASQLWRVEEVELWSPPLTITKPRYFALINQRQNIIGSNWTWKPGTTAYTFMIDSQTYGSIYPSFLDCILNRNALMGDSVVDVPSNPYVFITLDHYGGEVAAKHVPKMTTFVEEVTDKDIRTLEEVVNRLTLAGKSNRVTN